MYLKTGLNCSPHPRGCSRLAEERPEGLALLPAPVSADARPATLTATAVVLGCLTPVWYRCAVSATDEWAAAVRALVNTGRKPLAESLGLVLPADIADERRMWTFVGKLSRLPYDDRAAALNPYRNAPPSGPSPT
ncbi:hypothetical protein [Streptomyces sp. GbtcB7]|uniref:hypothetical protein n=1 Tax=Streptomyces sp. GbtcB7 TaxID=2824752 RepID=UPI001C306EC8|nr:hypothetical protein [Streptomyces sp. GbtcB7]